MGCKGGFGMAIDYELDQSGSFVYAVCSGDVNDADMYEYSENLALKFPKPFAEPGNRPEHDTWSRKIRRR